MIGFVRKDTRLNLRITPKFRAQIEALADYAGLTMSSYVHSLLVRAVREERERTPEAFGYDRTQDVQNDMLFNRLATTSKPIKAKLDKAHTQQKRKTR